jgi:hypothetical protein
MREIVQPNTKFWVEIPSNTFWSLWKNSFPAIIQGAMRKNVWGKANPSAAFFPLSLYLFPPVFSSSFAILNKQIMNAGIAPT